MVKAEGESFTVVPKTYNWIKRNKKYNLYNLTNQIPTVNNKGSSRILDRVEIIKLPWIFHIS